MNEPPTRPRLIVVRGLPGSGKTPLAKELERTLGAVDGVRRFTRALGASVELCCLSPPPDVLLDRTYRRGMDMPPIGRENLGRWPEVFRPPTLDKLALLDAPLAAEQTQG